jgi:hypothetical protein
VPHIQRGPRHRRQPQVEEGEQIWRAWRQMQEIWKMLFMTLMSLYMSRITVLTCRLGSKGTVDNAMNPYRIIVDKTRNNAEKYYFFSLENIM